MSPNKPLSSDEGAEDGAIDCPKCGSKLWLVRVKKELFDDGERELREYKCKNCGKEVIVPKDIPANAGDSA